MKAIENLCSITNSSVPFGIGWALVFFFVGSIASAQSIQTSINRDTIKIGEEVQFKIQVETDTSAQVAFPKGKSFGRLEVFETHAIDTNLQKDRWLLSKMYSLTQFNAGVYTIPPLAVSIDQQIHRTDTLQVVVNRVEVDTTQQKLYDIKKSIDYDTSRFPMWLVWVLIGIAIVAVGSFLFFKYQKQRKQKKRLPPYEAAIKELEALEKSESLQRGNYKRYYSDLTASVKKYLDEKVEEGILEKTTEEVIERVRALKNSNKLYLKEHVINSLEAVLRRADLTKFAAHPVDKLTARDDRKTIREDIDEFDQSIAPPSEEEMKASKLYRQKMKRERRKRNWRYGILGGLGLLIIGAIGFVAVNGWQNSKELVFGNQAKELLEKDWIQSRYGSPGISLTTPKVLVRKANDSLTQKTSLEEKATSIQRFGFGSWEDDFLINLSLIRIDPKKFSPKLLSKHVNQTIDQLEAKNITVLRDSLRTSDGVKGAIIDGKLTKEIEGDPVRRKYTLLEFGQNSAIQQILMIYKESEPAEKIEQRVIDAIHFKQRKE